MPISQRRALSKIPGTVFRRTYALSVGVKMKPLRKRALCNVKAKTNPNFAVKLAGRSNQSFLLFDESHFSNICTLNTC